MGMKLWKTQSSHPFGNSTLIEFLEEHGAEIGDKSVIDVPASAFRAALKDPEKAGLTKDDIAFIESEIKDADDDDVVDMYDIA